MLESIVKNMYFAQNNLFCEEQHGFRSMISYETQLFTIIEHWTRCIDNSQNIDVVCLDFQKAFDKVPHNCSLSKLKSYR